MSRSRLVYGLLTATGWPALRRRRDAAPIFCFHNVVPDPIAGTVGDGPLHIGRTAFETLLGWIARAYHVVPLAELSQRLRTGRPVRGLACLTFDDGYRGVFAHAIPALRARSLPATLFIVTDAATRPRPFWWDQLAASSRLGVVERTRCLDELQGDRDIVASTYGDSDATLSNDIMPADWGTVSAALRAGDLAAGSHSVSHPNLTAVSEGRLRAELEGSRQAIAEHLDQSPDVVAYPYGLAHPKVLSAAAEAGFANGLTLGFGTSTSSHHPLALPRINVPASLGVEALGCWATGLRVGTAPVRLAREGAGTVPPLRW